MVEHTENMPETDPIHFDGNLKKIETLKEKTKIQEAVTTGFGEIHGNKVVIAVMDGNFLWEVWEVL